MSASLNVYTRPADVPTVNVWCDRSSGVVQTLGSAQVRIGRPARVSPRAVRRGALASLVVALVGAAGLVWQSAYASFGDATAPQPLPTLTTGTVALSDDVEGYAPITLPEMRPGDSGSQCIVVTSTGSVPSLVKLYATGKSSTKGLLSYVTLSWVAGSGGGGAGSCSGFTESGSGYDTTLSSFPTSWGSGALPWNTTGNTAGESRTYRLTYGMSKSAPATTKGGTATVTFVWEAQQASAGGAR